MTEETFSLMLNVPAPPPWPSMKNKILFHDCMCYGPSSFFPCPLSLAVIGPVTNEHICSPSSLCPKKLLVEVRKFQSWEEEDSSV